MPAIRRGKQGGINQFLIGRSSYKTTYTMGQEKDNHVSFDLWICKYKKGKRKQHGIEYFEDCCLEIDNEFILYSSRLSEKVWD